MGVGEGGGGDMFGVHVLGISFQFLKSLNDICKENIL